jgi:hypothetical protein
MAFGGHADIGQLPIVMLGQLDADLVEMQPGYFFVEVLQRQYLTVLGVTNQRRYIILCTTHYAQLLAQDGRPR